MPRTAPTLPALLSLLMVAAAPGSARGEAFAVDAMVGQVNGQAVYADEVLDPIDAQLTALARQLPPSQFYRRAGQLVAGRVQQIVADALILGEAERALSDRERQALRIILQRERDRLLRELGRGSLAMAEDRLQQERGMTLDQYLEQRRQEIIISRFLRQELLPLINVSRRDIERYYRENREEFAPPPTRDVRVYIAPTQEQAAELRRLLAQGYDSPAVTAALGETDSPFREVFMAEAVGEEVFAEDRVNAVLSTLDKGEVSNPIVVGDEYWLVCVEAIRRDEARSLKETQVEIRNRLQQQQFQVEVEQYRRGLFESGSFNPVDDMIAAIMDVVRGRYRPGEEAAG